MVENFTRTRVSDFILLSEVPCHCGCCKDNQTLYLPDPGIVAIFDRWRFLVGHALPITSFYRCKVHNAKIGGAVDSLHLWAAAIDFFDPKSEITPTYLDRLNKVVGPGGLGIYELDGHFHIDCGHLSGSKPWRRWRGHEA